MSTIKYEARPRRKTAKKTGVENFRGAGKSRMTDEVVKSTGNWKVSNMELKRSTGNWKVSKKDNLPKKRGRTSDSSDEVPPSKRPHLLFDGEGKVTKGQIMSWLRDSEVPKSDEESENVGFLSKEFKSALRHELSEVVKRVFRKYGSNISRGLGRSGDDSKSSIDGSKSLIDDSKSSSDDSKSSSDGSCTSCPGLSTSRSNSVSSAGYSIYFGSDACYDWVSLGSDTWNKDNDSSGSDSSNYGSSCIRSKLSSDSSISVGHRGSLRVEHGGSGKDAASSYGNSELGTDESSDSNSHEDPLYRQFLEDLKEDCGPEEEDDEDDSNYDGFSMYNSFDGAAKGSTGLSSKRNDGLHKSVGWNKWSNSEWTLGLKGSYAAVYNGFDDSSQDSTSLSSMSY